MKESFKNDTSLMLSQKCPLTVRKKKKKSLVCGEQVAVFKEYSLNHHVTKHAEKYKNFTDAEWAQTADGLLGKLPDCNNKDFLTNFTHPRMQQSRLVM